MRTPPPSWCPLPPKPSCAFSPLDSSSRVCTVGWDYVEAPQGTARQSTQTVGKVQGGSRGQKGESQGFPRARREPRSRTCARTRAWTPRAQRKKQHRTETRHLQRWHYRGLCKPLDGPRRRYFFG